MNNRDSKLVIYWKMQLILMLFSTHFFFDLCRRLCVCFRALRALYSVCGHTPLLSSSS